FEYEEYNLRFNISIDYKPYLKEGEVSEELKKAFEENNLFLSDEARIFRLQGEYWRIINGAEFYVIRDTGKCLKVRSDIHGRGINSIEWNNTVLIVETLITATCQDPNHKIIGKYEVDGDTISLIISEEFYSSVRYQCFGIYKVNFKIKNLEKKDYTILLYKGKKIDEKQIVQD
ncbi:MAG: hypothetical protein KAU95_03450, partial [Candidatus Aenigmarchaeota archaeon]|nr:hypothetical protein [Candidatus Aenigmarchaeota archaeon]